MRNESPVTNWEPPMSEKGLDESYAVIREALEKNNRGNVVNSLQNCVLALTHDPLLGGHIRRNLFNERLTIDCPLPWVRESSIISDTDLAFLQLHLERHYGLKAERCLPGALKIAATDNAFHPVRDRLRALRWDGVPRVRNALHHFLGAEVNDYHERCLRTFMLGAVKRVFQPGCKFELMLVLVGGQGVGKSTFLRSLAMEPDWFSDDLRNLSDKDVFHRLNGRWIIEMSEMVVTANARSIEEIKAFLSRDRDFCRLAYDRFGADHPRQCVVFSIILLISSIMDVREEVSVVEVLQAIYWQNSVRVNMFLSANVSSSRNKAVSNSVFRLRSDKYPEVRIFVNICFRKLSTVLLRISSMAFSIASQTNISRSPFSRRD